MKGEELLRLQANGPSEGASYQTLPSLLLLLFCCSPPFSFFFLLPSLSISVSDKCACECEWCVFVVSVCMYQICKE